MLWLEPSVPVGLPNLFPQRGTILTPSTWANRPAASSVPVGTILPVMLTGNTEPRFFVSDGTVWRPQGAWQVLYHRSGSAAAPLATLTGDGTIKYWVLPQDCLLPGGMLYAGIRIEAQFWMRKSGTHTGVVRLGLATANDGTNYLGCGVAANATSGSNVFGASEMCVYADGFMSGVVDGTSRVSYSALSATSSSTAIVDRASSGIQTDNRFVVFGIGATYTDSAADMLMYSVAIRG